MFTLKSSRCRCREEWIFKTRGKVFSLRQRTQIIHKIFCRSANHLFSPPGNMNSIQHSKSGGNMHQQIQLAQHNQQIIQQLQHQQQQRMMLQSGTHPLQMGSGLSLHQSSHMPLVNSPSSGNILHVSLNEVSLNFAETSFGL